MPLNGRLMLEDRRTDPPANRLVTAADGFTPKGVQIRTTGCPKRDNLRPARDNKCVQAGTA